jgi:hypothetical protein
MAYSTSKKVTFPIGLAWSAISAADRINEGQYVNQNTYPRPDGAKFNKDLAMSFCENPGALTDEDKLLGETLTKHFSGLLFKTLSGPIANGFMATIANIIAMESVGKYEIACMSCLVQTYRKDLEREVKQEKKQTFMATSMFVGTEASKHELDIEIIDTFYSKNYNIFINTATDGVNIFKFSTAHGATIFPLSEKIRVKGSVKRHDIDKYTGVKETWLTRVKRI